jgi:hypothetical protein
MWGQPSQSQLPVIARHVAGRRIHDLGAAHRNLSVQLLELGASHVVAIESETYPHAAVHPNLTVVQTYFRAYQDPIDVAFVSWAPNNPCGLHVLLARAPLVIYLGRCTDGSFCGYPAFWRTLQQREILDRVNERKNVLLVYGPRIVERPLEPEEEAGMDEDHVRHYDEIYKSGPSS